MKVILTIGIIFIALHILIAYNLPAFIQTSPFPYDDLLRKYFMFYPFTGFANFDGYQYISIAKNGYSSLQQSYFPLFPIIISLAAPLLFKNYILTGMIITSGFFFLGLFYFKRYLDLISKSKSQTNWTLLLLTAFPSAFFYQMMYPESLFLFLSAASLYFLIKKNYLFAVMFTFFASITKIQGVLLIIPFFITVFDINIFTLHKHSLKSIGQFFLKRGKLLPIALSPLYGLLAYSIYLYINYKDPLYYYHAQSAFGAHRSTDKLVLLPQVLYRYIKIFITSQHNFAYWIACLEFLIFILIAGVLLYDFIHLIKQKEKDVNLIAINLYSWAVILLPTLTGTLTSFPRYALLAFSFFIALGKIKQTWIKIPIICIFLIAQVILNVYFLKGYFVS